MTWTLAHPPPPSQREVWSRQSPPAATPRGTRETTREFERRQGIIADQLIEVATAIRDAHGDQTVAIVVGSSSHATHRVVGSVAVSLARHSPVPLVIVP